MQQRALWSKSNYKVMGVSEISTWVQIRRYDKLETTKTDELEISSHELTLMLSDDVKAIVFKLIDVEDDGSRVLKIRRFDQNLIPMSTLLNGADRDKPFIIDVVKVHQFCPVEKRTILPGYIDALKSKFVNLETRILLAEKALPQVTTAHLHAVEDATSQLANCVSFLNRRVDELVPPDWRPQLCPGI